MSNTTADPRIERAKKLDEFKKSLDGLTEEQLKAAEQEVVNEADTVNKEVAEAVIDLPSKHTDAFNAIRTLLGKVKVQWQYASAMAEMYDYWNPSKKKAGSVQYGLLDATLRYLGQMEFEGYEEWKCVSVINSYFEPIKDEYVKISSKIYDVADKHNAILEKLDAYNALNKPVQVNEENVEK